MLTGTRQKESRQRSSTTKGTPVSRTPDEPGLTSTLTSTRPELHWTRRTCVVLQNLWSPGKTSLSFHRQHGQGERLRPTPPCPDGPPGPLRSQPHTLHQPRPSPSKPVCSLHPTFASLPPLVPVTALALLPHLAPASNPPLKHSVVCSHLPSTSCVPGTNAQDTVATPHRPGPPDAHSTLREAKEQQGRRWGMQKMKMQPWTAARGALEE